MSWKQVRTPNLDPVIKQGDVTLLSWVGWCLAYVQTAFGAPWAGYSAWDAWENRVSKRHTNRNFPKGVYFPVWFDGEWLGVRYGHVAIMKDGKIWSSPITDKPSTDTWSSIEEVERNYGMKYVGWSEDIGGITVIKGTKLMIGKITLQQLNYLYLALFGEKPNANAIKTNVGKRTFAETEKVLTGSALFKRKQELAAKGELDPTAFLPRALKQVYKEPAKAVVPQVQPTTLKPGVYEVK